MLANGQPDTATLAENIDVAKSDTLCSVPGVVVIDGQCFTCAASGAALGGSGGSGMYGV